MSAAIEHAVEVDRVQLPPSSDRGDILVEAGDECDVTRAGFGGDAGVGDTEGAFFEDLRAQEGCEWAGCLCVVGDQLRCVWCCRIGVRVGERLECLVCAKTVACDCVRSCSVSA